MGERYPIAMDFMNIVTVFLSILALIVSIVIYRKYETVPNMIDEGLKEIGSEVRELLLQETEPLKNAVSRSMGFKSEQAATARQVKTAEKYIVQDILEQQDPLIQAGLEFLSPRTKEYLEKNPNLVMQILPRIQALSQVEGGFNPLELFSKDGVSRQRPHPFKTEE